MKNNFFRHLILSLITLVGLSGIILLPISPVQAAEAISFEVSPTQATKNVEDVLDVQLVLNAGSNNISAVDVTIGFDQNKLRLNSFDPNGSTGLQSIVNQSGNGSLHYIGAQAATGSVLTGRIILGTARFATLAQSSGTNVNYTVANATSISQTGYLTVSSKTGGIYIITSGVSTPTSTPAVTVAPTDQVYMTMNPAQASKNYEETFDVAFFLNGQNYNISGIDFWVNFNKDLLEINSFTPNPNSNLGQIVNDKNNLSGTLHYIGANSGSVRVSGEINIGTAQFKTKKVEGIAQVNFSSVKVTASEYPDFLPVGQNQNGTYTIGAGPTATPVPTLTPSPTPIPGNPSITEPWLGQRISWSDVTINWNQMSNPNGGLSRVGLRIIKASNNTVQTNSMTCSGNNVIIDRWWHLNSAGNYGTGDLCPSDGSASFLREVLSDVSPRRTYTIDKSILPPGRYFVAVWNYDNGGYHCSYNCDPVTGQPSPNSFNSSFYFDIVCPANLVWDETSGSCLSATPTPGPVTVSYRIAEEKFSKNDPSPAWLPYTNDENTEPITIQKTLAEVGKTYTYFVQFKDNRGNVSNVFSRSIKYIGPDPVIERISCGFNAATGVGSKVEIIGRNFGVQGKGKVDVDNKSSKVSSWQIYSGSKTGPTVTPHPTIDNSTPTPASVSANLENRIVLGEATGSQWKVIATISEKLTGMSEITLTTDDNRVAKANCAVDVVSVTFLARPQCRPAGKYAAQNTKIEIYEDITGAKPIYKEKVSLNNNGEPEWSTPPALEIGKCYALLVKAPQTIANLYRFKAEEGTTVLSDMSLAVGDIAPVGNVDGIVNSLDVSELFREWAASSETSREGDFNLDNRINSIDYSCQKLYATNLSDAKFTPASPEERVKLGCTGQ